MYSKFSSKTYNQVKEECSLISDIFDLNRESEFDFKWGVIGSDESGDCTLRIYMPSYRNHLKFSDASKSLIREVLNEPDIQKIVKERMQQVLMQRRNESMQQTIDEFNSLDFNDLTASEDQPLYAVYVDGVNDPWEDGLSGIEADAIGIALQKLGLKTCIKMMQLGSKKKWKNGQAYDIKVRAQQALAEYKADNAKRLIDTKKYFPAKDESYPADFYNDIYADLERGDIAVFEYRNGGGYRHAVIFPYPIKPLFKDVWKQYWIVDTGREGNSPKEFEMNNPDAKRLDNKIAEEFLKQNNLPYPLPTVNITDKKEKPNYPHDFG